MVAAVRLDALTVNTPPDPAPPGEGVHRQAVSLCHQDTLLIHILSRESCRNNDTSYDTSWILAGYYLATMWILLGYYVDTTWILLGYYLDTTWILLGYYSDVE